MTDTPDTAKAAIDDIESCPSCGALPCDWVDNPHKGHAALLSRIVTLEEALGPFARLRLPARAEGNAGFYSVLHKDLLAARAALDGEAGK